MKKNKGFTLTEVIVSIVLVAIAGICIINIFMYKIRIDKTTNLNLEISNRIVEFFDEFSLDPSTFVAKYNSKYDEVKEAYVIYFPNSNSSYYLLTYHDYYTNGGFYQLNIEVIINNELYSINNNETFSRRIYYGG